MRLPKLALALLVLVSTSIGGQTDGDNFYAECLLIAGRRAQVSRVPPCVAPDELAAGAAVTIWEMREAGRFREEGSLHALIQKLVSDQAHDAWRGHYRHEDALARLDQEPGVHVPSDVLTDRDGELERVQRWLAGMEEAELPVFCLKLLSFSEDEIAQALNEIEGGTSWTRHRVQKVLAYQRKSMPDSEWLSAPVEYVQILKDAMTPHALDLLADLPEGMEGRVLKALQLEERRMRDMEARIEGLQPRLQGALTSLLGQIFRDFAVAHSFVEDDAQRLELERGAEAILRLVAFLPPHVNRLSFFHAAGLSNAGSLPASAGPRRVLELLLAEQETTDSPGKRDLIAKAREDFAMSMSQGVSLDSPSGASDTANLLADLAKASSPRMEVAATGATTLRALMPALDWRQTPAGRRQLAMAEIARIQPLSSLSRPGGR